MSPIALVLMVLAAGCYQEVGREVFDEGERFYLDRKYDEAIAAFRRYLCDHPEDAGAHFYLGTCYLASEENKWLVLAEGELQTALALFERQGKSNPIPRFSSATYFEVIGNVNLAKIYMHQFLGVLDVDLPPGVDRRRLLRNLIEAGEDAYEDARKIDPDAQEVEWLRARLMELRTIVRQFDRPTGRGRAAVPPGVI